MPASQLHDGERNAPAAQNLQRFEKFQRRLDGLHFRRSSKKSLRERQKEEQLPIKSSLAPTQLDSNCATPTIISAEEVILKGNPWLCVGAIGSRDGLRSWSTKVVD